MTISLLGCGWLGLPLGAFLVEKGYKIKGSVTDPMKFESLRRAGIDPFRVALTPELEADHPSMFFNCDVLIVNFPPRRREDIEEYHPEQIRNLIKAIREHGIRKVLFVSSTSVYPDINREVFEADELEPVKGSGRALKIAEDLLQQQKDFETTVLRFAGLVGPERLPGRFLAGKKDVPNGTSPVNLIHREDCIEIIYQIIKQEAWGELFNACSDIHPTRADFYSLAALTIGLAPPQFAVNPQTSFKIINSNKLKQRLGYVFKFPDPMTMLQA
ncbi:SDR family oxidoreductase [Desertivirga arenae]|uniref:SDR family oxidoreductase n=1 Tax=Desertivirga arenae TaxID=2810309 RepID=UPI001A970E2C|nr:SDR family oxidoreductase [Pedobacter sp. SYSU D00823]